MQTSVDNQAAQFPVEIMAIADCLFGGEHGVDVELTEQFRLPVREGKDVGRAIQSSPLQIQCPLALGAMEDDIDRPGSIFGPEDGKGDPTQIGDIVDSMLSLPMKTNGKPRLGKARKGWFDARSGLHVKETYIRSLPHRSSPVITLIP